MAHNDSKLVNGLAYFGLRAVGTVLQCYDVDRNMATIGALGDLWYRRDKRRRARCAASIQRSFPEMTSDEVQELTRQSMRHLLQLFVVEVIFTPRLITPSTWPKFVQLGNLKRAIEILVDDRPAIFITGHCGNFELLGFTLASVGFPLNALARPLDLPRINDWLVDIRQRHGMNIITKFGAVDVLPNLIEQGERIAFIADQNAGDKGLFVPFFGRLASAYKSIALLAMRYDVPIICGHAYRRVKDRFQYTIQANEVIEPEDWANQPDPLYYITARYTLAIENMVREAPEQYFWVHRRWKSRPRHERLGKQMPRALKQKISDLPWMTDSLFETITENSKRDAIECQTR